MQKIIDAATEDCMGIKQVNPHELIRQTVGETLLAILATDTRDLVYTTFDKGMADSIIGRVVDQVRNHWSQK